jgi:DNA-directed RNA polymerase subunit RPC12/RpoP
MADEMQAMLNAALTNDFERAKELLRSGLGINETIVLTNKSAGPHAQLEVTALHIAVMMSRIEVVRFLIANGADVEARDGRGRTPLELAKDRTIQQLLTKATDERRTANTNHERIPKMSFWSKLFGKKTSEPAAQPAQPGITSQLLSIDDIQRNDQEMGEMYLHCPKCGEEERINDMGKMMLKQGNNVFANYKCKKCGVAFDGAKHNVKRNA